MYSYSPGPSPVLPFFFYQCPTPVYAGPLPYTLPIADFERGFAVLENLPCDVLLAPHPSASGLWERVAAREQGEPDALIDATACRRYAATSRISSASRTP